MLNLSRPHEAPQQFQILRTPFKGTFKGTFESTITLDSTLHGVNEILDGRFTEARKKNKPRESDLYSCSWEMQLVAARLPPARDRALGLASSRWDLGSLPGRSDLGVGLGFSAPSRREAARCTRPRTRERGMGNVSTSCIKNVSKDAASQAARHSLHLLRRLPCSQI